MKLAMAAEMQHLDQLAIEKYAIPGIVLMENAGHGTVSFMEEELGSFAGKTVAVFAGPGNNGGDGLVIGRRIHQAGGHPLLLFAVAPEKLKGDAAINATIVQKLGLPALILSAPLDSKSVTSSLLWQHGKYPIACLVDALFGTGLTREIKGHLAQIISLINTLSKGYRWPVVAVDLPSGIDADTGKILGTAVRADYTATYGLAKPAHYLDGGIGIGKLKIIDIGIPAAAVDESSLTGSSLTGKERICLPQRLTDAHKGSHGHLLLLAGKEGTTGAAILAAHAALYSGCGLVTALVPHKLNLIFEQKMIEAMTIPLSFSKTVLSIQDLEQILQHVQGKTALVLGPGIGTAKETEELVLQLYQNVTQPMVVDADGLNILAKHRDCLENPGGPRILTPHPGEMSRLCGLTVQEVQENRLATALRVGAGSSQKIITVLKGAGTVIAQNKNGHWRINTSGNQGMATGGMGDVLAGLIGSLLAQKLTPWDAASTGVYLHGAAADILAQTRTYGYLAGEVAAMLPAAINKCSTRSPAE